MNKKVLIISPHFPPSNLAAVHRSRLFAQHLPFFHWEPVILMVHEDYYEENLDWNLYKLLPEKLRIEKVKAWKVTRPRVIGDIGLRGFFQLRKRALQLVKSEKFDFVYIPIPSFYVSLIGSYLNKKTGIRYGIDYIDPWVHHFPGSEKFLSRHWFSTQLAKYLEPMAVKKASLITGVAEGYYTGVQERNPALVKTCLFGAMPYGGEEEDHIKVKSLGIQPYLFKKQAGKIQFVFAGAFLPKAVEPLKAIFYAIAGNREKFENIIFHFIGTGKSANDNSNYSIRPIAEEYGIWDTVIKEYPARIPYLDVLIHLEAADAVFILGSTEPHYTPSKIYQAVLSGQPILAVLHTDSLAAATIQNTNSGMALTFRDNADIEMLKSSFINSFKNFLLFKQEFKPEQVNKIVFNEFSAEAVTKKLSMLLDKVSESNNEGV